MLRAYGQNNTFTNVVAVFCVREIFLVDFSSVANNLRGFSELTKISKIYPIFECFVIEQFCNNENAVVSHIRDTLSESGLTRGSVVSVRESP